MKISIFIDQLKISYTYYHILMQNSCCPPGSWPQLKDDYHPKGEDLLYEGVSIYRVGEGHKALVIASDIFGAKSGRHRHVADAFAALGYHVFLPEFLITPQSSGQTIFQTIKEQSFEQMRNRFEKLLKLLQSKGIKQFFNISFCWGVWFTFTLASLYDNFIAIAGIHPSLGIQGLFGGQQIDLVNKVKSPAYLYPASNDPPNVKKDGELVLALAQKFGSEKTGTTEFPEMAHGWSTRGDLSVHNVKRDVYKVFQLVQNYFSKF